MKINESLINGRLHWLLDRLKENRALPKNIDWSQIGRMNIIAAYNENREDLEQNIISESVFTGMDANADLATIKCLVEMVERMAFDEGFINKHPACQTDFSDGFAAYPRAFSLFNNSKDMARRNAYQEAIERYVWATWWDHPEYTHHIKDFDSFTPGTKSLINKINELIPIEGLYQITPDFVNQENISLSIFFAFLKNGGVVSGGACGLKKNHLLTNQRAINELFRHSLGLYKSLNMSLKPRTFYDERLLYFGSGQGRKIVEERLFLKTDSPNPIQLSALKFDHEIPHSLEEHVIVHRCFFENQPPFVGGRLERLCL